jgi:fructosamine-3-kinase
VNDELAAALGPIRSATAVSGGDINEAQRVDLEDGRRLFVKAHRDPPPGFFAAEASGLHLLADAGAIRVPDVVAVGDRFLALEWIEPVSTGDPARLGRELAALHRAGCEHFGLATANYVGAVPQDNEPSDDWPSFYATRRLEPLVRRNIDAGRLPSSVTGSLAALVERLPERCGPPEPPARLHGDLWAGNQLWAAGGQPVLVDPAVYGGHREIDLAMMRLFGGFPAATFAAYHEAHPLADGHERRVPLYQLYPLLVHVTLFGGGYARSFLDALARCT